MRVLKSTTLISALAFSITGFAGVDFDDAFNDLDTGTWAGQGNITFNSSACISSYVGRRFFQRPRELQLKVTTDNGEFSLLSNQGAALPFSLDITDGIDNSPAIEPLNYDVFSSNISSRGNTGSPFNSGYCSPVVQGSNAILGMTIDEATLYSVPAGVYSASVQTEACRANRRGSVSGDCNIQSGILATATVPPLIKISGLNDIDFGVFSGVLNSVTINESFCIYSNTTSYSLTASSTISGTAPRSFAVTNQTDFIDYSLKVAAGLNASSGAILQNGVTSAPLNNLQSIPYAVDCNGGDNASIEIEFNAANVQGKSSGDYSGTLILQVAPI